MGNLPYSGLPQDRFPRLYLWPFPTAIRPHSRERNRRSSIRASSNPIDDPSNHRKRILPFLDKGTSSSLRRGWSERLSKASTSRWVCQHSVLIENAQSERSQVHNSMAEAANFQLHVNTLKQGCTKSTDAEEVQTNAVCLGATELLAEAENRFSLFDCIELRKVFQFQHESGSFPCFSFYEVAGGSTGQPCSTLWKLTTESFDSTGQLSHEADQVEWSLPYGRSSYWVYHQAG